MARKLPGEGSLVLDLKESTQRLLSRNAARLANYPSLQAYIEALIIADMRDVVDEVHELEHLSYLADLARRNALEAENRCRQVQTSINLNISLKRARNTSIFESKEESD